MNRPTGFSGIAWCHFSTLLVNGTRKWRWWRFWALGIGPFVLGGLLAWKLGPPGGEYLPLIVAVYSVVAAVLVGLIPLAQSVIGQSDPNRTYEAGERPLAQQELDRIQTLQDLHAAISYATILLVVSLGACVVIVFVSPAAAGDATSPPTTQPVVAVRFAYALATIIYGVGSSTALTFFDVASGVFEAMENHAETLKRRIRNNVDADVDRPSEQDTLSR